MVMNVLDPLLRTRQVAIPELVAALRDIHHGKTADPRPRAAGFPLNPGGSDPHPASPAPRLILDRIASASEELARLLTPVSDAAAGSGGPAARRYSTLRSRFDRFEQEVREHAATVDRLVGRNSVPVRATAAGTPYQETLYLQCPRGGRTAGRFRCVNRRGEQTSVTSSLRPLTVKGAPVAPASAVTLRPGEFALQAGASEILSVEVDLGACPDLAADRLGTSIDLHMNNAIALKIWVEIEVYDGH